MTVLQDKYEKPEILQENEEIRVIFRHPINYEFALFTDNNFEYAKLLKNAKKLVFDYSQLPNFDSYIAVYTNEIEQYCSNKSIEFSTVGISKDLERFLIVMNSKLPEEGLFTKKKSAFIEFFENIGIVISRTLKDVYLFVEFLGELLIKLMILPFRMKQMRWKDFPSHFTKSGINAVPITVLIVFLIGVISGYQGAVQLSQFGADIYIANLIGISITRELSPLMAAIIIAGRSGSAFTAEIGTMKVSEEVDALTSMGFDKMHFLVMPRVIAVTIAMPIIVMICDIAGIAGGLLTALAALDITISGFLNQLQSALTFWDFFSGLGKALVFGFLISTVGCFRGLQVSGGAESVGKYTTASVVTSVFLIIFVDALFVFVFQSLGI